MDAVDPDLVDAAEAAFLGTAGGQVKEVPACVTLHCTCRKRGVTILDEAALLAAWSPINGRALRCPGVREEP